MGDRRYDTGEVGRRLGAVERANALVEQRRIDQLEFGIAPVAGTIERLAASRDAVDEVIEPGEGLADVPGALGRGLRQPRHQVDRPAIGRGDQRGEPALALQPQNPPAAPQGFQPLERADDAAEIGVGRDGLANMRHQGGAL